MLPRARKGADADFIAAGFPYRVNSMDRSNAVGSPQHIGTTTSNSITTATTSAPTGVPPALASPRVHAVQPQLPQDVLGYIAAFLLPAWPESPVTARSLSACWPIGTALRDLATMSQTCTGMRDAVAALRLTCAPHWRAFRKEAARRETAYRLDRGASRQDALAMARQRYGFVPRMPRRAGSTSAVTMKQDESTPCAAMEVWQSADIDDRRTLTARIVATADVAVAAGRISYQCDVLENLELGLGALEYPVELASAVAQCAMLRKLSISIAHALRPQFLMALQYLPALRALSLRANCIGTNDRVEFEGKWQKLPNIFDMLARMPAPEALESLRLDGKGADHLDMDRFAALAPRLTSLRKLALSPCWHTRNDALSALQTALRALHALEVVRFDDASWEFAEASAGVLAQHAALRDVRYRLSDGSTLPVITALSGHTGLEHLDVESEGMTDPQSLELLAKLLSKPGCRLQSLRVIAQQPSQRDVSPLLLAARDYGKLRTLCIGPMLLRLYEVRVLTECIVANRSLRHLGLPVAGHSVAIAIADALPGNDSLWSIDLGDAPLGEDAARRLADGMRGNRSLQQVRMNDTAVSEATRQRIAEILAANRRQ
jgi:hypothetical protein